MRNPPVLPFILLAAGFLQAFPFVAGRSMEYSVLRRGGVEQSIVTLTPVGFLPDSNAGKRWKFQVTDSLVSGTRKDGSTHKVLVSEREMHVEAAYMAWTTGACEIPWDVASPQDNPIPTANRPWGTRALLCAGIGNASNTFQTFVSSRVVTVDNTCHDPSMPCLSYINTSKHPLPEGLWSSDSGWISYHDAATGDSWVLNRIGKGARLPEDRLWSGRNIRDVRRGDVWVHTKIVEWAWDKRETGVRDTASGRDSTWIQWTALARVGDTGLIGTWSVARRMEGCQSGLDTVVVDFDSPWAYHESRAPADLALAVFRRAARPPLEPSADASHFTWGNGTTSGAWSDNTSITREYSFSAKGDFQKMVQAYHRTAQGQLANPFVDTTTTIALRSFERDLSSAVGGPGVESRGVAPRSIADLERLVADGGQILSIRGLRGARLDLATGGSLDVARRTRGVLFVEARTADGVAVRSRILRP
jgi:hypothetical protein